MRYPCSKGWGERDETYRGSCEAAETTDWDAGLCTEEREQDRAQATPV